jgi:hypothetical protein
MTETVYERDVYVESDTRRGRRKLLTLLVTGGSALLIAIFSIPFTPDGYPTRPWHWAVIVIVGPTTALVFMYTAFVLLRAYEGISYELLGRGGT